MFVCNKCKFTFSEKERVDVFGKPYCTSCAGQKSGENHAALWRYIENPTQNNLDVFTELVERHMICCESYWKIGSIFNLPNGKYSSRAHQLLVEFQHLFSPSNMPTKGQVLLFLREMKNALLEPRTNWDTIDTMAEV